MLKSIEFQLEAIERAGGKPNWDVGSLPFYRRMAESYSHQAEENARRRRYYEARW
jgi:hypothetical protein